VSPELILSIIGAVVAVCALAVAAGARRDSKAQARNVEEAGLLAQVGLLERDSSHAACLVVDIATLAAARVTKIRRAAIANDGGLGGSRWKHEVASVQNWELAARACADRAANAARTVDRTSLDDIVRAQVVSAGCVTKLELMAKQLRAE